MPIEVVTAVNFEVAVASEPVLFGGEKRPERIRRLSTISPNPRFTIDIGQQAVEAVNKYPPDLLLRLVEGTDGFRPFGYFVEPGGRRLFVTAVTCTYNKESGILTLDSVVIHDALFSQQTMELVMAAADALHPEVPKVSSPRFDDIIPPQTSG